MLDAPYYGFTPLELIWRFDGDWWHIVDIVDKPYHWFRFDSRNNPVFVGEYGLFCADPRPLPPGKFVFATHHATYDNPYGLRLLSRCLWPVSFKRGGLTFYARFVERHGMPREVGEASAQAKELEKLDMARGLSRIVQDAVAVILHGASVKLESAGQTQGAIHEAFLARQDRAISKVLMGQTLTVETDGQNSLAATEAHKDVADDLADADKAMVTDAWNEIAWFYTQVNAGSGVLAPLAEYEEPEDLNVQTDLDKKSEKWARSSRGNISLGVLVSNRANSHLKAKKVKSRRWRWARASRLRRVKERPRRKKPNEILMRPLSKCCLARLKPARILSRNLRMKSGQPKVTKSWKKPLPFCFRPA